MSTGKQTLLGMPVPENEGILILQNIGNYLSVDTVNISENLNFISNKSPTRCNNFPVDYPDVYLQLNMFRAFSRPSSGAQ